MALEYMLRKFSWNSLDQGRIKYGLIFILPFSPVFLYVASLADEMFYLPAFVYFIFYIIFTVILGTQIRKIAKQWPDEEYEKLNSDQVTFPLILILLMNSALHLAVFYVLIKALYLV